VIRIEIIPLLAAPAVILADILDVVAGVKSQEDHLGPQGEPIPLEQLQVLIGAIPRPRQIERRTAGHRAQPFAQRAGIVLTHGQVRIAHEDDLIRRPGTVGAKAISISGRDIVYRRDVHPIRRGILIPPPAGPEDIIHLARDEH
jgi:hypothetical protein